MPLGSTDYMHKSCQRVLIRITKALWDLVIKLIDILALFWCVYIIYAPLKCINDILN
jgi:hypothetical protein